MRRIVDLLVFVSCLTAGAQTLRVNHIGYLKDDIKAAVYVGNTDPARMTFALSSPSEGVMDVDSVVIKEPWSPFAYSARIYFSSVRNPGEYVLSASVDGHVAEVTRLYIGDDAYSRLGLNELPLVYLRQQRCGYNPVHRDNCHMHDGVMALSGDCDGQHIDVTGGWHDASDYLQYITTSATAVYQLMFAYRENPSVWADSFGADGHLGSNGVPDILDEARWGLEWMCRMNPTDSLFLNQIADDRDHRYAGLPAADSVDYGFGKGGARPVYPCLPYPAGHGIYRNRSTGLASSVGKFASSFGLGAEIFAQYDNDFAADLGRRSATAYDVAVEHPGVCQTIPVVSPYFYEEDNWSDDIELAAMTRYAATGDDRYLDDAIGYGRIEPVTPWMGADSARYYQWYPFVNLGHVALARTGGRTGREFVRNLRSGLCRVADRADGNVFMQGVPFIWCSNNLVVALVTHAMLYRDITGDNSYLELETAARDWLFGVNPWGQTMIMMPRDSCIASPVQPHSAMTDISVGRRPGRDYLVGGLVDGPVYRSIYDSLLGLRLRGDDMMAPFHGDAVYHDDYGDYSTNEPTLDGTASLTYMLGRLCGK
ncbi:MAG: glycoside hydrolase family 9 protein [Bacteroidales bacterium]|nr:glycoside hydrolase family 9 protein [Bacteroidales bacterium]